MDIRELEQFINYNPILDSNLQFLVDQIKQQASSYLSEKEIEQIQKAYEFAREAHKDQKRLSGEPYIVHPVMATKYLMKIRPDLQSIQACLLHDVIEDTPYDYEDIKKEFGEEVAYLCEWLVKVWKVRYNVKSAQEAWELRQLETLKKTFLAMWKDLRVIFVKLADRIHNIQTLHFHPKEEKRKRIALETLKIYVPIAQRLGLSVFQGYLENGAFRILDEKEFYRILNYVKKHFGQGDRYIEKWVKTLKNLLDQHRIKYFSISWRLKSPYRIYKKLEKYQTRDISKVNDILAFRIITDTIPDCYTILWIIHSKYTPLIKKIKDYIAVPKPNWYRSLHTTVLGLFKFPVEIQIRTQEMDKQANYGVAAHFAYKESGSSVSVSERLSKWIEKLQEIVKSYQIQDNKEDFKDALQVEILDKNIFVYTPKGDIVELPAWSTVLDFAFRIHTDIGLRFKNALVNGKIVPIDYKLRNWDIVEIKTFKNKYTASKSWLEYLYTPSAKAKLNRFLKEKEKDQRLALAKDLLNTYLKKYWLPLLGTLWDKISSSLSSQELNNYLLKLLDKQISYTKFIKTYYPELNLEDKSQLEENITNQLVDLKDKIEWNIIIDYDKKLPYTICPECNPKPGDKIIAKSGKDWIKIHKISCSALKTVSFEKLLEAHWKWEKPACYSFKLCLEIIDKPGMLLKVLDIFSQFNINIQDIRVMDKKWDYTLVNIIVGLCNPSKSAFLIKELKQKDKLVKIKKAKFL